MTVIAIIVGLLVVIAFIFPMLNLMKKREKDRSDRVLREMQEGENGRERS